MNIPVSHRQVVLGAMAEVQRAMGLPPLILRCVACRDHYVLRKEPHQCSPRQAVKIHNLSDDPPPRGVSFCAFCGAPLRYPTDAAVGRDLLSGRPPKCAECVDS
jgi:hypothetical protein